MIAVSSKAVAQLLVQAYKRCYDYSVSSLLLVIQYVAHHLLYWCCSSTAVYQYLFLMSCLMTDTALMQTLTETRTHDCSVRRSKEAPAVMLSVMQ